ncbi:2-oxoacid:acceptor oxidoreductase family protein [Desulfopila sp. IMCC35008]|uniref:2-oxoacid:acceptor oxidoreductase family protein n=1 Tax=Desulfopila sp. IMCC35008 TaxID=2653858 RepID=UPI0013D02F71|nr:2-oxoacid:acceptor oxidoreductase family protein [Desulfopila sp. IMCC35008]
MSNIRLVFSGSGGQGVITAAIILAEAAVIYSGKNATQTQAYGAAARGGSTRTDIIISDSKINYPGVIQPNILMTLTQNSYNSFSSLIRPGGLLLTDPRFVETTRKVDAKQLELPMYEQVMSKIGKPIVYNICTLGALVGITQILEPEAVLQVLEERIPKDFLEMNMRAFDLGLVLGSQYQYRSFF